MEGGLSDLSVVMDMKAKELTNLDKWYGMEKGDPRFWVYKMRIFLSWEYSA